MPDFRLSARLQNLLAKSGFNKLEKREQRILIAGLLFLVGLGLYHFALSPLLHSRQRAQKAVIQKKADIITLRKLQEEYRSRKNQAEDIEARLNKRPPAFTLFTFLEEQASKAQVKQQITSMTPSTAEGEGVLQESRVDLKLEQISLQMLVDFLQQIESPENVVMIRRISVQENSKEAGSLDATMQAITFTRKAGS